MREGARPSRAHAEHDFFELYLLGAGLPSALQGLDAQDLAPAANKDSRFRGEVAESHVMRQLIAGGALPGGRQRGPCQPRFDKGLFPLRSNRGLTWVREVLKRIGGGMRLPALYGFPPRTSGLRTG